MASPKHKICNLHLFVVGIIGLAFSLGCADSPPQPESSPSKPTVEVSNAPEVLAKLRSTYRQATSYTDNATVVFYSVLRSTGIEREVAFTQCSLALTRPNKFHLSYKLNVGSEQEESYEIVSNGTTIRSSADEIPDQIHEAIAPRQLSVDNLIPEPALRGAVLQNSIENSLPQLALLLTEAIEQDVFPGENAAEGLPDAEIEGQNFQRVKISSPAGKRILWIDPQTYTLRRMEIPIDTQRKELNANNRYSRIAVWIDFEDVTLDAEIDQETFSLAIPEGAQRVRRFIPPPPPGFLGQPPGEFSFRSLDGETVTPDTLAGKVAVIDFWGTQCSPCKLQTPVLNQVYRHFRKHDEVEFLAVSGDSRVVDDEVVQSTLASWGGQMPVFRDPTSSAYRVLRIRQTPTLVLLDRQGRLQSFQIGAHKEATPVIEKIQRLVDGEDLTADERAKDAENRAKYDEALAAATIEDSIVEVAVVEPDITPQKMPERLRLKQLWQSSTDTLAQPGDVQILTHETWGPAARMIALDGGSTIVELNFATGEVLGRHDLPEHQERRGGFLRTWRNEAGEQWTLASGVGWQQVYVFDSKWESVLSFPDEPHSGIGDVQFGELTGSDTPVLNVGYWGGLGVQGGTLEGLRLWSNRRLDHVLQIGRGPATDDGQPTMWCTSSRGTLMQLGADGKSLLERYVTGQALMHFASRPDGLNHCGLSIGRVGEYTAVGFDDQGAVAWEYKLPPGEYVEQVPRVLPVSLPNGDDAWMVVAANGSVHWLNLDGQLIDRFDYGAILTGIVMRRLGDQTLLFVATAEQLSAWEVQSPVLPVDSAPPVDSVPPNDPAPPADNGTDIEAEPSQSAESLPADSADDATDEPSE